MGFDEKDVTAEVRNDHDGSAKNRIIVPNGLPFRLQVDESQASHLFEDTGRPFSWTMRCQTGWGCALNPHPVAVIDGQGALH